MELNSAMASLNDDQDEDLRGFAFINISHPDEIRQRSTQRTIRRRVMTAVGRSRRRRPLALTISINIPPTAFEAPENVPSGVPLVESPANLPYWEHVPRSLHPSGLYPVEPDSRALQLIYFSKLPGKLNSISGLNLLYIVNTEADYVYRPFRLEWFSMALIDRSAFYLSLANAALFFNQMTNHGSFEYSDCLESSKYYSECLNQVTRRLGSRTESVSEGVITTVLGFICHDVGLL
jgi:hypothetical protein